VRATSSREEELLGPHDRWLNVHAIVQAASEAEKRRAFEFLKDYFGNGK
jgi:hypothetical protein